MRTACICAADEAAAGFLRAGKQDGKALKGILHGHAPWDARAARKATLKDLNAEAINSFVSRARRARNFPLPVETDIEEVLTHLNLLDDGKPTNAAILLFGQHPQRFTPSSEIKCAHFHGTEVAKPIPSYQVYKGTAFELVDQAIDFVMSKINVSVGTRKKSSRAPITYEIPRDVIAEAIVNAVAHRDYNSNGSVQVMLLTDRLEVWNPGTLPAALTLDKLRLSHSSFPVNPLLAESLYLTSYIERMGTGTSDMIAGCLAAGLPEPEFTLTDGFVATIWRPVREPAPNQIKAKVGRYRTTSDPVTDPVTDPVDRLISLLKSGEVVPSTLQKKLGLKHRHTFRENYLHPALKNGLIERTILEKPTSRLQKYRLTEKGRKVLERLMK